MKTLVIVESPNKIKKISEILGDDYIVVASVGHIVELGKGGHHGIGVDIDNGFKPRYVLMDDKVNVLKNIHERIKECDNVVLFCDPDREGASIAWHVQERIKDFGKPIKSTSSDKLSKKKVLEAFQNLKDIDMNMVRAQEARRVLDRIVGFTASPFLSKVENSTLSAGRVQSVAVRLVVDRENDILNFKPETYYTIDVDLVKNNKIFKAAFPVKIKNESVANDIAEIIKKSSFIVKDIEDSVESKSPPAPMITSTLQQVMSKLHGFSAEQTMKAAQSLYESGLVSYIRTDSPAASKEDIDDVRNYLKTNNYKIPKKQNEYKAKSSAQEAHECIRPVNIHNDGNNGFNALSGDEKKTYDVIWKYFIASQCESAKFSTRKVIFECSEDSEVKLKSSGKCVLEKNFMEILDQSDDSKIDIPELTIGEIINKSGEVNLQKKKTKPLPRFSLADLIADLEKKGICRPSTFADILSKIEKRGYVEKKGNVYHPTELGIKISNLLKDSFKFMDYNFTSDMEDNLDKIAEGKLSYLELLKSFYPDYKKELTNAYIKANVDLCKKCNSPMVVIKDKEPFCSNYRNCKKGN